MIWQLTRPDGFWSPRTMTHAIDKPPCNAIAPPLKATLGDEKWSQRLATLHGQLFASEAPEFDDVMIRAYVPPEGYVLADQCIVHDGKDWHLFYITGPIQYADAWIDHMRHRRFTDARKIPYEMCDGHAVGPTLSTLRYRNDILTETQGEFALLLQGSSGVIRFEDHWVNVYTARGPGGQSLCLARSRDLDHWDLEPSNPIWRPPAYASPTSACKNAFVMRHPTYGRYLIYYCLNLNDGMTAAGLLSTTDFVRLEDHGPVFKMPTQLRGTAGIELSCVVYRQGMWHLFVGCGPGVFHAVSPSPDDFTGIPGRTSFDAANRLGAQRGSYLFGRFHCIKIFEHDGRWWMISTRKEHQRWLNRQAGVLKFRGSAADESSLLGGMYLCEIKWQGDMPVPTRLTSDARNL